MRTLVTGGLAAALAAAALAVAPAGAADAEHWLRARGEFAPVGEDGTVPQAVTYDEALVPAGAEIRVGQRVVGERMVVDLSLGGLVPGHAYGVHVHTDPCGADPEAAGPHYRHMESGQPRAANEVWLDVTANGDGGATAVATREWVFRSGGAGSVVLHEHHSDQDGGAGKRVACFTVPFAGPGE
ncbi:superoxide dismutase family protein [Streptomyces sp. RFCAC02]|uniref:superoxide dismutase family protein n=1 Tax=Streptomyces sp. RFCAC02 TaxID=2499143 RepID=UPI001F1050CB|nr:superoxide dismutase family protein [Streptomyces sp. RFCAC02]